MDTCKLCLQSSILQDSHIIPDCFFRYTKEKTDKTKNGKHIRADLLANKWAQESFDEPLMCRSCEQRFANGFENYIADIFLRNPNNVNVKCTKNSNEVTFENLNYDKLKLFQMSLIWRASLSSSPFYAHVNLSNEDQEFLRENLDMEIAIEEDQFPCVIERLFFSPNSGNMSRSDLTESKKLIIAPKTTTIFGFKYVTFVFGGWSWRFYTKRPKGHRLPQSQIADMSGKLSCSIKNIDSHELLKLASNQVKKNELNSGLNT